MSTLDLALVGNGTIGALIHNDARISWCCFPRFDGDPVFCSLLRSERSGEQDFGHFSVDLINAVRTEQQYVLNTPVLLTRLYDDSGGCVEVTDFAPRYKQYGRVFCPMMLVRQIRAVSGNPRIRIRLSPAQQYGRERMRAQPGSNHITYGGQTVAFPTCEKSMLKYRHARVGCGRTRIPMFATV